MNTAFADLQSAHELVRKNTDLASRLSKISAAFNPDLMAEFGELTAHVQVTNAFRQQLLPLSDSFIQDEFARHTATLREALFAPQITRELEAIQTQHDRLNDTFRRSIEELTRPLRETAEAISAQFSTAQWISPLQSTATPCWHRSRTESTRPATTKPQPLSTTATPVVEEPRPRLTLVSAKENRSAPTKRVDAEPPVPIPDTLEALALSLEEHLRLAVRPGSSRLNLPGNAHHGATVIRYQVRGHMITLTVAHGDATVHHLLLRCSEVTAAVSLIFSGPQHKK